MVTLESVQCVTEWQGERGLLGLVRSPVPPHLGGGTFQGLEKPSLCFLPSRPPLSQPEERPPASLQTHHWWAAPRGLGEPSVFGALVFPQPPFCVRSVTWCSVSPGFTLSSCEAISLLHGGSSLTSSVHMNVCAQVCMHAYARTRVHMFTHMNTCACSDTYMYQHTQLRK